jgi:hypothetical protein
VIHDGRIAGREALDICRIKAEEIHAVPIPTV